MLDMRFVRDNSEDIRANLRNRNFTVDLDRLLEVDRAARSTLMELEQVRRRRNEIGNAMKRKLSPDERKPLTEEGRGLKEKESELDAVYKEAEGERDPMWLPLSVFRRARAADPDKWKEFWPSFKPRPEDDEDGSGDII